MHRNTRSWAAIWALAVGAGVLSGCRHGDHNIDDIEYRRVEVRTEQHVGEVEEIPPGDEMVVE